MVRVIMNLERRILCGPATLQPIPVPVSANVRIGVNEVCECRCVFHSRACQQQSLISVAPARLQAQPLAPAPPDSLFPPPPGCLILKRVIMAFPLATKSISLAAWGYPSLGVP